MPTATITSPNAAVIDSLHEIREVPEFVLSAIARVAASGWRDMYDRETVMMLAATFGYGDAAEWLVDHRHLYFIALRRVEATAAR